jgi:S1-C subfamily serine protease
LKIWVVSPILHLIMRLISSLFLLTFFLLPKAQAQLSQSRTFIDTNPHLVFTQAKPSTFRSGTVDVGLVIHNRFTYQYESISTDQFAFEQRKARSIFRAVTAGGGGGQGTAFLVGPDLVLTNLHLMLPNTPASQQQCGKFSIERNDTHARVACKKVEYCDSQLDFCLIRMESIEGVRPLRFNRSLTADSIEDDAILFLIGNAEGLGIQSASSRGPVRLTSGLISHCVPSHPGNSGSPLMDDQGQVIGIHYAHAGNGSAGVTCPHQRTTGYAISSVYIFNALQKARPELVSEIAGE